MNPFVQIVPRDEDEIINEEFIKEVASDIKKTIKSKKFITLLGNPGMGKTQYLINIHSKLKSKKEFMVFDETLADRINKYIKVRNKSLFIDNLDLSEGLDEKRLYKLTNELVKLLEYGMIIVTAMNPDNLKRLIKINPLLMNKTKKVMLPKLTREQAINLIIKRLNEVRKDKSDKLSPFTKDEVNKVIMKSGGNPRMILMLLGPLYEMRNIDL